MSKDIYLLTITQAGDRIPLTLAAFTSYPLAKAEADAYARTHQGARRVYEKVRHYRVLCEDRAVLTVVRVDLYDAPIFAEDEA